VFTTVKLSVVNNITIMKPAHFAPIYIYCVFDDNTPGMLAE